MSSKNPAAAVAAQVTNGCGLPRRILVLESSNCLNVPPVAIQQTPCSGAPVRTVYNGPGRLGQWNTQPEPVTEPPAL